MVMTRTQARVAVGVGLLATITGAATAIMGSAALLIPPALLAIVVAGTAGYYFTKAVIFVCTGDWDY